MKNLSTVFLLTLWVTSSFPASAQERLHLWKPGQAETPATGPDTWQRLHITDALTNSREGQEALADFHRRKAMGLLPRKHASTNALGDTMTFKVLNYETSNLDNIDFKLMVIDEHDPPRFQVWVELAELDDGTVDAATLASIEQALGEQTPAGSINTNAGILENDEVIFGDPPDVDGDGATDVLLVDIRDGFDQETSPAFLAGFVTTADLTTQGNNRDVLYLDTSPTLPFFGVDELGQTAAHEYQHLIHYSWDRSELSFINEGLSEWAEIALGYRGRSVNYLSAVIRYNVSFYRFNRDEPIDDYERAGLFITYIADRFGPLEAGKITRQTEHGNSGLRDALIVMQAGTSLEDLLFDFHTANFFNDTDLDARFGYTTQQRQGLHAVAGINVDGRTTSQTPSARVNVREGSAQYLAWQQVRDFSLTLSPVTNPGALRLEALLFGADGSFEGMTPLNLSEGVNTFDGTYSRIVVVAVHTNPEGAFASFDYDARWTAEQSVTLVETQYDNDQAQNSSFFLVASAANPDLAQATRFTVPSAGQGTMLDQVSLAPFYSNQFANPVGSENDTRDFSLYIFGPGTDGQPGEILFSHDFEDPRPFAPVTSLNLNFFDLDLSPYAAQLSALPETIYIGYGEVGTETTVLVVGPSPYTVENVSYIGNHTTGNWTDLWDIQFQGGEPNEFPVRNTVIPIRARFAVPTITAAEDAEEVPARIALDPNFPNPFNPTTSIRYALPLATHVRLAVYDLLGREVAVLADGLQPAGPHQVQVDAADWASGVYFYTLETAAQTLTQRMVLIK